jgi:hypothetical protein
MNGGMAGARCKRRDPPSPRPAARLSRLAFDPTVLTEKNISHKLAKGTTEQPPQFLRPVPSRPTKTRQGE